MAYPKTSDSRQHILNNANSYYINTTVLRTGVENSSASQDHLHMALSSGEDKVSTPAPFHMGSELTHLFDASMMVVPRANSYKK
jgi:hypothetical protein